VEVESERFGLLRSVFRVKYLEDNRNSLEIAELLKLDPFECLRLELELEGLLRRKLGRVDGESLETLCPQCLEASVQADLEGERACTLCGFVLGGSAESDASKMDDSLPFDQSWGRPTSDLSVGHSLGDTIDAKLTMEVLKDNCHVESVGLSVFGSKNALLAARLASGDLYVFDELFAYRLRATRKGQQIVDKVPLKEFRNMSNVAFDTLQLRVQKVRVLSGQETVGLDGLLKLAGEVSRRFGLFSKSESKFNNSLGANVRRAFRLNADYNLRVTKKRLVETMFFLTLNQFGKTSVSMHAKGSLDVDEGLLDVVWQLGKLIERMMLRNKVDEKPILHNRMV